MKKRWAGRVGALVMGLMLAGVFYAAIGWNPVLALPIVGAVCLGFGDVRIGGADR